MSKIDYKMAEYENLRGYSAEEVSDFLEAEYENFHKRRYEDD